MIFSIIGTAGRKQDSEVLTREIYAKALRWARAKIEEHEPRVENRVLKSGGAAWMDHLAVSLFKMGVAPRLELHLPARWNSISMQYEDEGDGRTANYYHKLFSKRVGVDTLAGLHEAIVTSGCGCHTHRGFHARNLYVGRCNVLLALTTVTSTKPRDGGTQHTWDNSDAPVKIHQNPLVL